MRKVKLLTVASLLLIGSSTLAFAGPHHGMGKGMGPGAGPHGYGDCMMSMGHRGGHMGMFGALNLTPEQQQKMRDIMSQHRNLQANRPIAQHMTGDLYNLITSDNFDEAQVRKQIEDNNKQFVDRGVEMAKIHHEMYQVLTPEQKAQAKAFYDQRMEQWKQRMELRAKNMPNQ